MESGQIGVLLSADCVSYVSEGGLVVAAVVVRGAVCMEGGSGTALIDTFSSYERRVKPSVALSGGIPGQTGCLYGDGREVG